MNVILVGDVVGDNGTAFLEKNLRKLKSKYKADFVIVNGENAAEGNGILPRSADRIFAAGADCITLGNHALRRREIFDYLDSNEAIIRPANFHPSAPGREYYIYDTPGKPKICVINLIGSVYLDCAYSNAFEKINDILNSVESDIYIVDFHAEATSEKFCMAYMLDGRVSLVAGTHTHIQTADERILPGGTGYITDLGMCGAFNSALGVRPELALKRFTTNLPTRFENSSEAPRLSGIFASIDDKTKKCLKIERINVD